MTPHDRLRLHEVLRAVDAARPASYPFADAGGSPLGIALGVPAEAGPAMVAAAATERWQVPAAWTFGALDAFDGLPRQETFSRAALLGPKRFAATLTDAAQHARAYERGFSLGDALRRVLLELPGLVSRRPGNTSTPRDLNLSDLKVAA